MKRIDWFVVKKLTESVTMIREPLSILYPDFMTNWLNLFVIFDQDECLLIDTGTGIFSYKTVLRQILEFNDTIITPLTTHHHFDHVGSLHEFNSSIIHEDELNFLMEDEDLEYISNYHNNIQSSLASTFPSKFLRKKVDPDNFTLIRADEWIKVGKNELQIILLPGHTSGSLGLYFPDENLIFPSDALQNGYVYADHNLKDFKNSLDKLLSIIGPMEINIMPSHEEIWLTKDDIYSLQMIVENYMSQNIENYIIKRISNSYLDNVVIDTPNFKVILPK